MTAYPFIDFQEDDPRIPAGMTVAQEVRYIIAFDDALAEGLPQDEAHLRAMQAIQTPEERLDALTGRDNMPGPLV